LDEKYPINGKCQRTADQKNKGKTRSQITELNISKGNLGKHFYSTGDGDKNLVGSLKLEGFTNLRKLTCSGHELIGLDVSDCSNLKELNCQNNQLNNLNVNKCSNLKNIDCSNNNNLKKLDLDTCANIEEVNINNCSEFNKDATKVNLNYDELSGKLIKGELQIIPAGDKIRNILIVGITGSGKSALSNTLTNANNFKESSASSSKTKYFQSSSVFEYQGRKYRIIDNIGFGDTNNISKEEILFRIGEGIHEAKEGINQILFLFKDRFSPEHIEVFNALEKFVSKSGIAKFTTLVRTNFVNFGVQNECQEDKNSLLGQNEQVFKIIRTCKGGVVHVDNPTIPVEDDEEKIRSERIRNKSREKVLKHLAEDCQDIYKLKE